jgi:hypothetical protein
MPITIPPQPFTFASESGNQPAAQLDSSFSNIRGALTGIALQASDLIGSYGIRNLVGNNNAGTPNTKYDMSADLVVLRNPSGGLNVQTNTGTLTNDTGLAGSAAGGRDQAGAFGSSTWIHFYFIWSGSTLSTLSSTVAPPTGPTLPTGYTHWAYAGAVFNNASPLLVKTRMRGSWMLYESPITVLNAGTATVETSVSVSTAVPPNALSYSLVGSVLTAVLNQAGDNALTFKIRIITGVDAHPMQFQQVGLSAAHTYGWSFGEITIPNIGQSFFYLWVLGAATTPLGTLNLSRYQVPNGGE